MNMMELRVISSDFMTELSSIQNVYHEIIRELELISKIVTIQNPSYSLKVQALITRLYSTIDQINTLSNQCSDSIMRYTNDSGEILDKLSFNLNKAVEHLNGIDQEDV